MKIEELLSWREYALQTLDSPNGVTDKAFIALEFAARSSDDKILLAIMDLVKATDGFCYLPEDWKNFLSEDLLRELS